MWLESGGGGAVYLILPKLLWVVVDSDWETSASGDTRGATCSSCVRYHCQNNVIEIEVRSGGDLTFGEPYGYI
jgi:hypothetical protein